MPSPYDPVVIDGMKTSQDGRYHTSPLPGEIGDMDAALDLLGQNGWDLIDIYGRNAVFESRAITGTSPTDAFGRTRTSEPYTIGDYKIITDVLPSTMLSASSGTAGVTMNVSQSSYTVYSSGSSGSYALVQSKKYHNYMPGKSQLILQSFVMGPAVSGSIKRAGYFDDHDGIFLEQDQTGSLNWVIRSSTNDTVSENRVKQSDWNIRTLFNEPYIIDVTKSQLLFIDFQWLAVGRVRCGFAYKGEFVLTHVFDHSNVLDKAYMREPDLPVRVEVRNTTTTTASMVGICATVMSEGGNPEAGKTWAVSSGRALQSVASGSTQPLLAIRLKNKFNGYDNRSYVRLIDSSVFAVDRSLLYRVYKLPSQAFITTSSAWVSVNDESCMEYNINISGYTDGRELLNGFVPAGGTGQGNFQSAQNTQISNALSDNYIAQNFNSTDSEIYVVVATNLTANATTAAATMQWAEVL